MAIVNIQLVEDPNYKSHGCLECIFSDGINDKCTGDPEMLNADGSCLDEGNYSKIYKEVTDELQA